ncbi:MAG: hypothetical protein CL678_14365 [Bdellovibrionaceae bacterium]|nr:hypothetical protein [Pseudobdellovibrionaceae bacterium]
MDVYVISDLHIESSRDSIYQDLLNLIENEPMSGDFFVFAGDIFDHWIGNKQFYQKNFEKFISIVQKKSKEGVIFYYIEGNHDFLLKGIFGESSSINIVDSFVALEHDSRKIIITHGDLANPHDKSYLLLRKFWRSIWIKCFVAISSGQFIDFLGRTLSRGSSQTRIEERLAPDEKSISRLIEIYHQYAEKFFSKGFDCVVAGHCHDRDEYRKKIGEKEFQYINVGFPRVHGEYLVKSQGSMYFKRVHFTR